MPAQPDGDDHPPEMGRRMMTSASAGGWSGSKFSVTSAPRLGPTGRGSPRGAPVGSSLSICSMTDAASDLPTGSWG